MSPVRKRTLLIIALFVFFSGCVITVSYVGLQILSVVRAYVTGESTYSRGQKDGVFYLQRYAIYHQESDYQLYLQHVVIPLGDRQARLALEKPTPDLKIARQGFITGRNHPEDVDLMVKYYRYFHLLSETRRAVQLWAQADEMIVEITRYADQLHEIIRSGNYSELQIKELMDKIVRLDSQVSVLEDNFSATLGAAARRIQQMLFRFTLIIVSSILALCIYGALMALRNIRQSEEKYRTLFKESHEGVFIADKDGHLTDLNPTGRQLLNLRTPTDLANANLFDFFAPDETSRHQLQEQLHRNRRVIDWEAEVALSGGTKNAFVLNATVQTNERGTITAYRGSIRDITERKRAEAQLKEQNAELQKINSELDSFVYRASHDMRAPLASLLGLINLVNDEKNEESRKQYIDMMQRSVNRLDRFIHNIINHSKNARLEVEPKPIHFREMADVILADLQYMEGGNDVGKQLSIEETAVFYSDEFRLKLIFNNMLSNAIRYRNPLVFSYVRIKIKSEADKATIQFEDNGQGIAQEYIDKIFNMFYRASTNSTGSGLGLYIVKEAVDALGGQIQVNSTVGQGTVFVITLPNLCPESKPAAEPQLSPNH